MPSFHTRRIPFPSRHPEALCFVTSLLPCCQTIKTQGHMAVEGEERDKLGTQVIPTQGSQETGYQPDHALVWTSA